MMGQLTSIESIKMAQFVAAPVGDPNHRSRPAVSEKEARRWPDFGPLRSNGGGKTFPNLMTVRAFRREHWAIRQAQEALRPAQVRGLFQRSARATA